MVTMKHGSTTVIIIGGSLVGLSMALCLAAQNISCVVLERHPGSSLHPRALGFTSRTMEIYRSLGFQKRIKEADPDFKLLRARVASLAGEWYEQTPWTENLKKADPLKYSVSAGAAIPQDQLEDVLRDEARARRQIELRYSNTLLSFEQNDSSVTATVEDQDGQHYQLRAAYMVAADGNRSRVRQALGIEREGEKDGTGKMGTISSVLFRAPLEEYLKDGVAQFNIDQPDLKVFMTHYLDGRWALMFTDKQERTDAQQKAAIYQAIGRTDIDVDIITTGRWELSMLIADRFRVGRVFLAGDAAHTLPPNRGGFGANTGIADAWNLAWKLAAVCSGASKDALLDTYEAERRAIALLRKQQIAVRADYKMHHRGETAQGETLDEVAMEVGELYRSAAVAGVSDDLPPARRPDEWKGQPGTRAAHMWMVKDDKEVSSLDLFGREWTLISENAAWKEAAEAVSQDSTVKIRVVHVGPDVQPHELHEFRDIMGIANNGASLVRPDGIIAWRHEGHPDEAGQMLRDALRQVAVPISC